MGSERAEAASEARIGPYALTSELGRGAMGSVFRAHHTILGREVAIKILDPQLAEDRGQLSRFLHEAKIVNAIRHPNIIDVTDFLQTSEPFRVAFVMELLDGRPLSDAIARGPFTARQTLNVAWQVLDALDAVHQVGAVHRDLKPDNVFVLDDLDTDLSRVPSIKVLDFGIAKIPETRVHQTAPGALLGTPAYMAPEQLKRDGVGPPADVYAWAELVYEMLTGRRLFTGEPMEIVRAKLVGMLPELDALATVPELRSLVRLVEAALANDPGQRPTAGEAKDALRELGVGDRRGVLRTLLGRRERPLRSYAVAQQAVADAVDEVSTTGGGAVVHLGPVYEAPAEDAALVGPAVHVVEQLMGLAPQGRTLVTADAADLARRSGAEHSWVWSAHGSYRVDGVMRPVEVFEVSAKDAAYFSAPTDVRGAERIEDENVLAGWRPAAGAEVPGRPGWRLVEKLGPDASAETWLAKHAAQPEPRVFKFCFDAARLRAMRRELRLFRILRDVLGHRADINRVYEGRFDEAPHFVTVEYVPGRDIATWLASRGGVDKVPLGLRIELAAQVADALGAAHSVGVLHGNLDANNVLVDDRGPTPRAVVGDFGESGRLRASDEATLEVTIDGRAYAAPETLAGEPVTASADLYALGVLVYRLVVGDLSRVVGPEAAADVEDPRLQAIVTRLLDPEPGSRADDAAGIARWLRDPAEEPGEPQVALSLPSHIGHYRVLREIGRGGMGLVYEAEQESPRRRVAVKVLKSELVPTGAQRRFEYEAQVLARLEHPGIAHIYEAGSWSDGRGAWPFIAMEYIEGEALDRAVFKRQLGLHEVLRLGVRICDAVQHAHQKGVIHRDLKPANILVSERDGEMSPRVLDFGVARLVDEEARPRSFETNAGQIVGTLSYMSPEQVRGAADIDTRSDVYALGMILHLLLAGKLPFELRGKPIPEAARIISEVEPPRLGGVDGALAGDVETIVAKALEKDRERRYASAGELGADLRRFLADEPISALPPSFGYQLRKFARRRRGLVTGLAASLLALMIGFAVATVGFVQASRERDKREAALREEQSARKTAEAVTRFLADVMAAARPEKQGRAVTLRQVLDQAAKQIDKEFAAEPDVQSKLHSTLGRTYISLGAYAQAAEHIAPAIEQLEVRYGPDDARTLAAHTMLGEVCYYKGDYDCAEREFARVLERQRLRDPPDEKGLGSALGDLGFIKMRMGHYEEARALLLESKAYLERSLGPDHGMVMDLLSNIAVFYTRIQDFEAAEPLYDEIIERNRRKRGPDHPETLLALANKASMYQADEEAHRGVPLLEQALEGQRRVLGPAHSKTLITVNNLGYSYAQIGRYEEGAKLLSEGLAAAEEAYGTDSKSTMMLCTTLGRVHLRSKRLDEADALFARVRTALEAKPGVSKIRLASLRGLQGEVRLAAGDAAVALRIFERCLAELDDEANKGAAVLVRWRMRAAEALVLLDRRDDARRHLKEALRMATKADRADVEAALAALDQAPAK